MSEETLKEATWPGDVTPGATPPPIDYVNVAAFQTMPLDAALAKILKGDTPGGSSGPRGWSVLSQAMICPKKYEMILDSSRIGVQATTALEVGALVHLLLAWRYGAPLPLSARPARDAAGASDWLRKRLLEEGVNAETVIEAYRLYQAYDMYYSSEPWTQVLFVEHRAEDKARNLSCRYDLGVRVETGVGEMAPGNWIVEHKTAARADTATLEGWKNDGQILGQQLIYRGARLDRTFGKLTGVLVNLIIKTKVPQFYRIAIPVEDLKLRQHAKDLRFLEAELGVYAAAGYHPRKRTGCVGRYGLCQFFNRCAGDE